MICRQRIKGRHLDTPVIVNNLVYILYIIGEGVRSRKLVTHYDQSSSVAIMSRSIFTIIAVRVAS